MEGAQATLPVAVAQAGRGAVGDDAGAIASDNGAMITPQAIIKEEHSIEWHASRGLNHGEVALGLVCGEWRGAAYLQIAFEQRAIGSDGPSLSKD